MLQVGVVTGFVPLPVKHLSETQYHELYSKLYGAIPHPCVVRVFHEKLSDMWLYKEQPPMEPANPVPSDRYAGKMENVYSNIVQHNRTDWAVRAMEENPEVDVWVWLDYGIMKQGAWRNNPIKPDNVKLFLTKVAHTPAPMDFIPFPGIEALTPVRPTGNNFRFCGSTHIWPKQYLRDIDRAYKSKLRAWIKTYHTTPLDLPIWAVVEQLSPLPFRFYQAEYDASQLDNYPYGMVIAGEQHDHPV